MEHHCAITVANDELDLVANLHVVVGDCCLQSAVLCGEGQAAEPLNSNGLWSGVLAAHRLESGVCHDTRRDGAAHNACPG